MHIQFVTTLIAAIALALILPAQSWAQQVDIIDCEGALTGNAQLQGCKDFDEELLPFARDLAKSSLQFASRLPDGLDIIVVFNYEDDFSHQVFRNQTTGAPLHQITIGEGIMIQMWNSYVDVWAMYDDEVDAADSDFSAYVTWALYHEIGHALVTHSENLYGDSFNKRDHETLADDFATITMIRLYEQGLLDDGVLLEDVADDITPAEQAAEGLYFQALPVGQVQVSGKRNALGSSAPKKKWKTRANGKKHVLSQGAQSAHEPNEERAWNIGCLTFGSGQAPHPKEIQGDNPTGEDCEKGRYNDILDELAEFAPGL